MDLSKIGKSQVVSVMREASLETAARVMREHHVGNVIVVEIRDGKKVPVGILTDRDIVMATTALGAPTGPLLAGDLMTANLVAIREDESLIQLIQIMKNHGVKRVPIVSEDQELVGIVALDDVISLLAAELSALAEVANRQKEMEFERRRKIA